MSAYQSAVYNWIKATNTVRVDPIHRRVAHGHRAWEPLQNKVMELRKVSGRSRGLRTVSCHQHCRQSSRMTLSCADTVLPSF